MNTADDTWIDARSMVLDCIEGNRDHVVYFAHSRLAYCTKRAIDARRTITRLRPTSGILDPSKFDRAPSLWHRLVQMLGNHELVYKLVVGCVHEVIAAEHNDFIGRGVYMELEEAMANKLPHHVVRGDIIVPIARIELFNPDDWSREYGRVITNMDETNAAT